MPGYTYKRKAAVLVSRLVCCLKSLALHVCLHQAQLESLSSMAGWALTQTTACCLQGHSTFVLVHTALQSRYKSDLHNSQNPHSLVSACQRVLVAVQL